MSEQADMRAEAPHSKRPPTSHERRAGQPRDASYLDGPPPWDIGEPQPAVRRLATRGGWRVASVSPDRILTRFEAQGAPAWLAQIERMSPPETLD